SSLRRTLTAYCGYYHNWRTHLSLGKDAPEARRVQFVTEGEVVEMPAMSGLHHRYERRAPKIPFTSRRGPSLLRRSNSPT
ncbi:MAG TPA: hypothetical protein VK604_15370, partial [Bryobacteraceae bacterium]|nr:hypothetical protein [Bryobacteraceae bacterium]